MAWTWHYEGDGGDSVTGPSESFPNQSDAETWLGESWRDLRESGIGSVSLFEEDRKVYGPMSLDPA